MKVRVILKGKHPRKVDDFYLKRDGLGLVQSEVAFSVGFPILMTSEESLESLRKELPEDVRDTIGMKNFRANLVIRGCSKPYEEDEFGIINIGGARFHCDAPCGRCVFINHDPESKDPRSTKHEPLKTLMRIRRNYPHIYKFNPFFGIYLIPLLNEGSIEVGQAIQIISRTEKTEVKEDNN
ncbi:hypothetical protein DSO57_1027568 [Entomophthora muscae]|uniref:Uncharacterized protein n=1 Tax=Entomophthora muscae TaxID=34485 RepID=A0ACC2U019_9FUNG|nr:hypothetical protein DSO57_1027568 [Entomophthora muscae]